MPATKLPDVRREVTGQSPPPLHPARRDDKYIRFRRLAERAYVGSDAALLPFVLAVREAFMKIGGPARRALEKEQEK